MTLNSDRGHHRQVAVTSFLTMDRMKDKHCVKLYTKWTGNRR